MQKEDTRFAASTVFEGLTSIRAILKGKENAENDRKILRILYDTERESAHKKELAWLKHRGEENGFTIEPSDASTLNELTVGSSHGGIVAECSERSIPPLSIDFAPKRNGFYVMIQGIEDPYNFGYALRSLYASGVDAVILPERNWMSAAGVVCRSSAGASEMLPIYSADALFAAKLFKGNGYSIVCADTRTENLLHKTELKKPLLLIVGGEKRGISRSLLDLSDTVVMIPYGRSFDAALSAASAATILGWEIYRQNENSD